jgi:hypothetical protein
MPIRGPDRTLIDTALRESDLVEQPVGPAGVRHIFRPVREQYVSHDPVPVPLLAAGELRQVGRVE